MNKNESIRPEPSNADDARGQTERADSPASGGQIRKKVWRRIRWLLVRAGAMAGTCLLFTALVIAGAGWYTSRPQFCRSCHIMEPYYVSWEESTHKDVSCIKCHFAPGVAEKVRGKMLGLVQLAKYVTASEGPRPAAEIPDASCLRSGCHETRMLAGRVDFHGIPFDHKPHLENLRREKKLRCTSCHSQIVQGSHMTVTTSTCFLCHFKEGVFNSGLGACTGCHQIPDEDFDLGGGMMFNHDLAYERGVGCASCHGDLIRGDGAVPPERCGVCHNREDDLEKKDDHPFLHQKHVTEHKVDCLDCHLEIVHSFDHDRIVHSASDCQSCHPDHHSEQVRMLRGVGAKNLVEQNSSMLAARVACPACHQMKEVSPTGVLWKASTVVCAECHDGANLRGIRLHYEELESVLSDLHSYLARLHAALESADLDGDRRTTLTARLEDLEADLEFLTVGNGIHNIHYATSLTRVAVEELISLCLDLEIDRPRIAIPEW